MKLITSGYFFWIMGFVVGQIYYLIDAPYYEEKRINAFCYGLINLVGMMVGAKIMYVIENFGFVLQNGLGFQGFSLYGAIFIQPLSCYLISLIWKKDFKKVASFVIIPMVLMLAFYRIDCTISGCCGGITIGNFVFPTQITECVFCLLLAGTFIFFTHKKAMLNGQCFVWFFVIYGAFRFVIEFLRVRTNLFWVISVSHLWSLLSIGIGIVLIVLNKQQINNKNTAYEA